MNAEDTVLIPAGQQVLYLPAEWGPDDEECDTLIDVRDVPADSEGGEQD